MRRVTLVALAVALCCAAGLVSAGLPTCGATCTTNGDCVLSQDGCSVCRDGKCSQQCGAQCNKDSDCGLIPGGKSAAVAAELGSGGQCFVCYFNQCGSQYCGSQCSSDSQCASNPLCKVCTQGACSPPPTPKPSVPPTPAPPTPPPTPAPGKAAWGAIYCAQDNCGTSSYFNFGATLAQAETIAEETTPTNNGQPVLYAYWTQPLPCAALVLSASFTPYFVNSTDLGTASTQAVSNCRAAGHSQCFLSVAACAIFPPTGSKWGGIATVGSPESLGAITLETNNGTGYDTWQEAMNVTMNDCQGGSNAGTTCGLTAVFYNCMAFANTPQQAASVNFANSLSAAKSAALQSCFFESEGEGGCTIASAACIEPFHQSNDHTVTGGRTWRFNKSSKTWVEKNQKKASP